MNDSRLAPAQSWIEQCELEHTTCGAQYDTSFKPTRLIDVGRKGKSPRLINTKDHDLSDDKYLALSHCWGQKMPANAITKLATLNIRMTKIPLGKLPKTFKHAISVTRRLGLYYLWIDSISIVQDSKSDWQQESALMGKVYANSYCTIAAASSSDCNGGLFHDSQLSSIILDWENNDVSELTEALFKPAIPSWNEIVSSSILNQRGWTLQERELSPRIIYFTRYALYFECREAFGEGTPRLSSISSLYCLTPKWKMELIPRLKRCMDPVFSNSEGLQWLESSTVLPEKRYNIWFQMIEGYSARKLSIISDKFPAISGLAAEYSYMLDDDYVAGLWRQDIIRGLCWRSKQLPQYLVKHPTIQYGPSWSWARLNGPITYDLLPFHNISPVNDYGPAWSWANSNTSQVFTYQNLGSGRGNEMVYGVNGNKPKLPSPYDQPDCLPCVYEVKTTPEGTNPNGTLVSAFIRMQAKIVKLDVQFGRSTCSIGMDTVDVTWDIKPENFRQYYLLSLGKVNIGLVITQKEIKRESYYVRVGIAPVEKKEGSWFLKLVVKDLILV